MTTQVYRVYIKATPEAIWDAITKPEWTEKYGYPGRGEYDLRPGGRYLATADEQAQEIGNARGCSSTARSSRSIRRGSSSRPGGRCGTRSSSRRGPTRVTWEIAEEDGGIAQPHGHPRARGCAEACGAGQQHRASSRRAAAAGVWILSDLKTLLETGQALES